MVLHSMKHMDFLLREQQQERLLLTIGINQQVFQMKLNIPLQINLRLVEESAPILLVLQVRIYQETLVTVPEAVIIT
ncbi:hypothetical protein D0N43_22000 [Klebsiella aerogenes]|uniref:Uncharacterized protein n=1 Tax=Klebsiella aerogenes (strain ATCC 13048 / DSM 30053 / CCUG 1429 / JCM 1235 / KCTC 2190 / NBRC 13534 / NCIMB 10102 / NCTC 10006 / CDC 819-56) TaxID=1028307 RepID=A0A0H3FTP0_KLEAK|nr:hypothetical protein EAE_20990 [Klebsiella aerogenes KCTC 2190]QEU21904.1 hypothetical protein FOB49_05445 [Klebsiella aerogenes]RFP71575.1 hypothetical protein D0N43_22000 [Klebsiella aerogenes]